MPRYRVPFLAAAGVTTTDGRVFESITWRDLPLPLAFQTDTQHADLATSELVGQIVELEIGTDGTVSAVIDVDPRDANGRAIHPEGARAAQMVEQGGQGISIDGLVPFDATISDECLNEESEDIGGETMTWCTSWLTRFSEVVIGGATLTPIPAFERAIVEPAAEVHDAAPLAMVASAALSPVARVLAAEHTLSAAGAMAAARWSPVPAHFERPAALTVESNHINVDGDAVYGWVAAHGVCHQSFAHDCVRAEDQSPDLSRFLRNTLDLDGARVPVGFLTMDTGHADGLLGGDGAAAHYDNTSTIAAIVTAGVCDEGVWFAGTLNPGLSDWQRGVLAAAAVSGDWRADRGESLRTLRAALVVPVPGFQLSRVAVSASTVMANGGNITLYPPNMWLTDFTVEPLVASGCGCGGKQGLTAEQTAALARLADERIRAEVDAELAAIEEAMS